MSASTAKNQESTNVDTITVTTAVVGCEGSGDGLGHPKVYLNIGHDHQVTCPYCSRHFVLADGVKLGGH